MDNDTSDVFLCPRCGEKLKVLLSVLMLELRVLWEGLCVGLKVLLSMLLKRLQKQQKVY